MYFLKMNRGTVDSIFVRGKKSEPVVQVSQVRAVPGKGLDGDYCFETAKEGGGLSENRREATLIEAEAIDSLRQESGLELGRGDSRRNIVTRGVPLNHLVEREFSVGSVRLRGVQLCEPCSHLESLTRKSVLKGLTHRGGLRAQILTEGVISVGDTIEYPG